MAKCFILLMTICLIVINIAGAQDRSLSMAISNWEPYKGQNLPDNGIASDIARQVLNRMGYSVKTIVVPWKRALVGAAKGNYDLIPAIWLTPEREKSLLFTSPILESRVVVISLKSYNFTFSHLQNLKGETVGVGRAWAYPDDFLKADYFIKEEAIDLEANINKLLHGRFNIIVGEEIAARYTISSKFKDDINSFRFSSVAIEKAPLHVAFSRKLAKHDKIAARFNQTLKSMQEDGTYKLIMQKHGILSPVPE